MRWLDLLGQAHLALAGAGPDGVGGEAVLALDDVVAGLQIDLAQQGEDLVAAVAEGQALGLQLEALGHGGAQDIGLAVGIDVQAIDGVAIGLLGLVAAAQDVLVARQLHRMGDALDLRLAADIGVDVHDPGLGNGTGRGEAIGGRGGHRTTQSDGRA
jgi:hypothetical protein